MILHLDMDAFFASVEQLDNPSLRGRPLVIGGQERGVVATASYEARAYGIHSAMPMATARKLCPHGVFMRGHGARYVEVSQKIMSLLRGFSPVVQPASIDEAYLDISGLGRIYGSPAELALAIKRAIREATGGLTCSIGISHAKFLAKICSDIRKPDGLFILPPAKAGVFLPSLPVGRLPGVGKAMRASLESFGIFTVGQLQRLSLDFLTEKYGKFGTVLHERAHGIDRRRVHCNPPPKSEGAEKTFARDIMDRAFLESALLHHAEKVGASLRKHGLAGHTVTIKIKFADFRQITRSRTIPWQVDATRDIFEIASGLLALEKLPQPVRLLGLSVSGFESRNIQLFLPGLAIGPGRAANLRARSLDRAIDEARRRFGHDIIHRASIRDFKAADRNEHHFD